MRFNGNTEKYSQLYSLSTSLMASSFISSSMFSFPFPSIKSSSSSSSSACVRLEPFAAMDHVARVEVSDL